MIRLTALAARLVVAFAPIAPAAMAATAATTAPVTCSTATPDKFQPQATLEAQLKAAGLTVRQIKVEGGCYEVYAVDKDGKKVNNAYNAETLEQVVNAEAGEK